MTRKIKPISDYILIVPDKPKSGAFDIGAYISETAIVEAVGPKCSEEVKKLVGKKVIFNSWKCEEKTIDNQKYFLVPESGNAICATI